MKAYLDIETSFGGEITVIGLYAPDRGLVQLVGGGISDRVRWVFGFIGFLGFKLNKPNRPNRLNKRRALEGIQVICTYNGSRFDLPVIRRRLGLDLCAAFTSHDLMYDCWRRRLYGGLKRVEERLGISRRTRGIDGVDAMRLWHRYETSRDREALATLLEYNREDVLNLECLDRMLRGSVACA
ncbi:MAG: ribonuclease H-like domain-containing protein [candidate division NC10 bacterium]|nr:ribonuclease H-like domain-containing protein [candidate division NC10 bacterium]